MSQFLARFGYLAHVFGSPHAAAPGARNAREVSSRLASEAARRVAVLERRGVYDRIAARVTAGRWRAIETRANPAGWGIQYAPPLHGSFAGNLVGRYIMSGTGAVMVSVPPLRAVAFGHVLGTPLAGVGPRALGAAFKRSGYIVVDDVSSGKLDFQSPPWGNISAEECICAYAKRQGVVHPATYVWTVAILPAG